MFAGQKLGIKEVDDAIWLVSFMIYGLGNIDLEQRTLQPIDNPFATRLSPMSWEQSVTYVSGMDKVSPVWTRQNLVEPRSTYLPYQAFLENLK